MILHQQLLSGAAERVLIVVPETLQHQWLVEMLRRFNLRFSLFDDERYAEAQHDADNPFETEQLVICSWTSCAAASSVSSTCATPSGTLWSLTKRTI